MLTCEQVREQISLYIDHELTDDELQTFEQHLSTCEQCRQEVDLLKSIVRECNEIEEVELPDDFKQQLHQKLVQTGQDTRQTKRRWYMNWKAYSGLAAAILLILLVKTQVFDSVHDSINRAEQAYVTEAVLEDHSIADTAAKRAPGAGDQRLEAASAPLPPQKSGNAEIPEYQEKNSRSVILQDKPPVELECVEDFAGSALQRLESHSADEILGQENLSVDILKDELSLFVCRYQITMTEEDQTLLLQKLEEQTFEYDIDYEMIEGRLMIGVLEKDGMPEQNVGHMLSFIQSIAANSEINDTKEDVTETYQALLTQYDDLTLKIQQLQQENSEPQEIEKADKQMQEVRHRLYEIQNSVSKCIIEVEIGDSE